MDITLQKSGETAFYRCTDSAWNGAAHGFSTRLGGVSPAPLDSLNLGASRGDEPERVSENFRRFCVATGTDPNALVKNQQVHGTQIRPVTMEDRMSFPGESGVVEADGLITDQPGVCLAVFSADCIPVLLYDPVSRVIAAAHAGWRGTAAGIAGRAVGMMVKDYGCKAENILAAIGPGIDACCFETHRDVPDGLYAGLGEGAKACIHPIPGTEKFRVDLKRANVHWLKRAGVLEEHISVCDACTACRNDLFWSHRRMGNTRGSMAAVIQLV